MGHYLITGGTGLIGSALAGRMYADGHQLTILSRHPERHRKHFPADRIQLVADLHDMDKHVRLDGIINLAGSGIADRRWSETQKQKLLQSRLLTTRNVVSFIAKLEHKPAVMISGSAIGYYGSQDDKALAEDAEPHREFTHELCRQWEEEAEPVTSLGVRLCLIRTGIVLARHGGTLKKLLPAYYLCLGGPLGSGRQMMSWIHLQDQINAIYFLLANQSCSGPYNLCSPQAVSNREFSTALGKAIGRPAIMPLPAFVIRLLFGEMGKTLLLQGQRVVPRRLLTAGFSFEFATLEAAFADIFRKR